MWSSIWNWIKSFFKSNKQDILSILIANLNTTELKELCDADLKDKALQFVRELWNNKELTGAQKAAKFNAKFIVYAKKVGKAVAPAMVNLLRELAYLAVKVAVTQGITTLLLADGTRVDLSEEVRAYKRENWKRRRKRAE